MDDCQFCGTSNNSHAMGCPELAAGSIRYDGWVLFWKKGLEDAQNSRTPKSDNVTYRLGYNAGRSSSPVR